MPRAFDRRIPRDDHNPLANLLDFSNIDQTVEQAGDLIRNGVINVIKQLTGIDLSSPEAFLVSLTEVITTGGPLVQGLVTKIFEAAELLEEIPIIGPILGDIADLIHKLRFGGIAVNAGNIFGRLQLPQFASGVSIADLTTAVPNLVQRFTAEWVPEADGWSFDEAADAAKVICNGTTKTLFDEGLAIKVESDQELSLAFRVRYSDVTSGPGQTIQLVLYTYASDDGSGPATPVVVGGITNPSGTISTPVTLGDPSWEVPPGVGSVRPVLVVSEAVTTGVVFWLNTPMIKKSLWPGLGDGLPAAFQARIAEWQSVLDAFKGGSGGSVADIPTALNNAGQGLRDALANALGHAGTGHTAADILGYFQAIPKHVVDGLEGIFDEIKDVFDGNPVAPANPVGDAIKSWWDIFFGGGPKNVVTQNQIAESSGVPPVDANVKVPWVYLPEELTTVALGMPWVELTKSDQSIPVTTNTRLSGWSMSGSTSMTITGDKFKVPWPGMWNIEFFVQWASYSQTYAKAYLVKNGTIIRTDARFGSSLSIAEHNFITTMIPADTTDEFGIHVEWNGTGSTKDVTGAGTYVRVTYLGATSLVSSPTPTPSVTFDAAGGGDDGSGDLSWSQVFGANAKTIVVPISHTTSAAPTVTVSGGYTVPVLSGPTYIGNYFGFDAYCSLAAAILPNAVKGTTRTVTVDWSSNTAGSANSMTFNNVASLGTIKASSGNGTARMLVPSNAFSMVACQFGGMDVNFGSFNRTQVSNWSFSAGNHWAHVLGYATGGLEFTASAGKWAGKGIELHP